MRSPRVPRDEVAATQSPRAVRVTGLLSPGTLAERMRDEEEIREQYEFLTEQLEDEDMNHEGVKQMFTYYKRAIGWVLEEEHM